MRTLRNAFLTLTILLASSLMAQQQYFVNISGHHTPCDPSIQNSYVYIESLPGIIPQIQIDVPVNENCYYNVTLEVNTPQYGFQVWSACANGITSIVGDTLLNIPPGSTIAVVQDFDCSTTPPACTACFTATQAVDGNGTAIPFSATFTSCATGGTAPYTYLWDFSWAGAVNGGQPTMELPAAGTYIACLNVTDANGEFCSTCDSVVVDADGNINPVVPPVVDCLGITNGPNVPGSPCSTPMNGEGTWNANCECVPNTSLPCEAGFWVMQAYDTSNNGDTTQVEPIPFELWVWNLSSGGTGNYSFVWDFGDGTTSTEAFPTHVYGASGPYNLCLTMMDDSNCEDTFCEEIEVDQDGILGMGTGFDVRNVLTIRVIQELPTGINERASLEATKLWPNPVVEQFNLTLNSSRSGNLTMTILDLNGREVRTMNASVIAGNNQLPMDVSGLGSGMYVLRLSNGSNSAAMRFVKH